MLLAIDIGNTTIAVGGFQGDVPVFVRRLPSAGAPDRAACASALRSLLSDQRAAGPVEGAVLSSVVPRLTDAVSAGVQAAFGVPVMVVGPETDTGLIIPSYDRHTLGSDRVLDAVAALSRWTPPLVVCDMGTATTLSVLDGAGAFLGGMILPGLRLGADALSAQAAQLPAVDFAPPQSLIGTDTLSCMRSGVLYGAAAAIEGLVQRIEDALGQPAVLALTGGHARRILPCLRRHAEYDEHLLMKGLCQVYRRSRQAQSRPAPESV